MLEFSKEPQPGYVPTIDWAALTSDQRGKVLQYLNYQIQAYNFSGQAPANFVWIDTPLWKEYEKGTEWTWQYDRAAFDAGRYSGFDVSAQSAFAQAFSNVPYGGDALAAVVMGEPLLPVLAGEAIKAYALTTAGDQLIAELTAPAATVAQAAPATATQNLSTIGAATMETVATNSPVPTLWDQVTGIVSGGVTTATQNAVNRLLEPAPKVPQYGQAGYTGYYTGNSMARPVLDIPVWGWVLASVVVAGVLAVALKR